MAAIVPIVSTVTDVVFGILDLTVGDDSKDDAISSTQEACIISCASYHSMLQSAYSSYSTNVSNAGQTFKDPSNTIDAICDLESYDIAECLDCSTTLQGETPFGTSIAGEIALLGAWHITCQTKSAHGVDQAYACWSGLPSNNTSKCDGTTLPSGGSGMLKAQASWSTVFLVLGVAGLLQVCQL